MKSRTVQPHTYADRGVFDDVIYGQLIYRAAERNVWPGSVDLINGIKLAYAKPTVPSSPFFAEFAIDGYYESIPSRDIIDIWIGSETFLEEIDAKSYAADTPLVSLAKKCLQPDGLGTDRIESLRDFIVLMNDDSLMRDRASQFWLMPIVLMRAKHFRNAARAIEA